MYDSTYIELPGWEKCSELIFPEEFATKGVDEDDFNTPFDKEDIYRVFRNVGV